MRQIHIPRQMGQAVRSRRLELGLTRRELADKAGVSERLVLSLEQGEATGIRLDKLLGILGSLGLSLYVGGGSSTATAVRQASASPQVSDEELTKCYEETYADFVAESLSDAYGWEG
ncbi:MULTISPECIES: helix-turn-helix domain-containing protein [Olsenella]|uniref:helix-turn-helix domain-containing protein n=1 Tax=Olsenella TaxID=133925 RepID=UPI00093154B5|nr:MULTISPECIES: helix-turn-helix domain-containing protein [Olsenella]